MLAMVVNDNARYLMPRGVLGSIASMLAPTGLISNPRHRQQPAPQHYA